MASLLIIGGTGFFGKSILDAYRRGLLSRWSIDKVIIVARHIEEFRLEYNHLLNASIKLVELDISVASTLPDADFIIHAAASTNARNYLKGSAEERKNIHLGTANFVRLGVEGFLSKTTKIVFCSSGAVYGQQGFIAGGLKEEAKFSPIESLVLSKRDYSAAKRDAESMIQNFALTGYRVGIARCFAFLGTYLPRDQHFAIGNFIENGLKGESVKVEAERLVYRSYLYADDLVICLMEIADKGSIDCPIYNVGSEYGLEIRELGNIVADYFNVKCQAIQPNSLKLDDTDYYVPNIEKIQNTLNIKPSMSIECALEKTVKGIVEANKLMFNN
jgi:dTDP-glucose 4,6-dehydratase